MHCGTPGATPRYTAGALSTPPAMSIDPDRALTFLSAIRFAGPDAATFLQGQLTQDTRRLADGRTLLAACNTPQGRVVAILRLRQSGDSIYALLPADLAEPVAARLRKFVLRAKVDLAVGAGLVPVWLQDPPPAGSVVFGYAPGRQVGLLPRESAGGNGTAATGGASAVERDWFAADIVAGLPQVLPGASEHFVAQMLNLDLLDAISFAKGCYTGQEIVARTQHLGRIKRRTFRYRLPAGPAPAPLAGLFLDGQKVGEVVMSAAREDGVELLSVTALDARDRTLWTEDGREAAPAPLPYPIGHGPAETSTG